MTESNGTLVIPPDEIVFKYLNDDREECEGRIDVVEAQLILEEGFMANEREIDGIKCFQEWLKTQGAEVSFAQTWTILLAVERAFDEFKKKLPEYVRLRIGTESTQGKLTEQPMR